jgi:uncharacterized protein
MSYDILVTILVTSAIQSLFGVGVLLFGTPILLLLGYDFIQVLLILLPISAAINLMQIIKHHAHIDMEFYKKIVIYTIPFVMLLLFLVTRTVFNVGLFIGVFLILVALKSLSAKVNACIESLVRYEKCYFVAMGIIHGLTNLGGSLLTAIVHTKNYEKNRARVTIAVSYGTFAVFQMLTLALSVKHVDIAYEDIIRYMMAGALMFLFIDRVVYTKIDDKKYRVIFSALLLTSGMLLTVKSISVL